MHAAALFNFEGNPVGTYTPFTDVDNGISATFTSNGDPGGFAVFGSFFTTLSGNVLVDPGPAAIDGLELIVDFSKELDSVSLDFAINPLSASDTFTLSAYQGGKLVGTSTESGVVPPGSIYLEGVAAFEGEVYNKIVLSSTALDLAVDDISVIAAPAPEPAPMSLLGLASLAGVMVVHQRKRA